MGLNLTALEFANLSCYLRWFRRPGAVIQQSCLQGQSCQGEGSTEQAKAGEAHGDKGDGVGRCVCV